MKTNLRTHTYKCLDCTPLQLPFIFNSLKELGVSIRRMELQEILFWGVGYRIHFDILVPELVIETIVHTSFRALITPIEKSTQN